jgi:hypothetical protein
VSNNWGAVHLLSTLFVELLEGLGIIIAYHCDTDEEGLETSLLG